MTRCPRCGKKPMTANKRKLLRGHYNPVNRYRKYPNLQWAKIDGPPRHGFPPRLGEAGSEASKRIQICTSCIKTLNKVS